MAYAPSATPRVLVIGFDGATLDLVGPWVRAGRLPTLARLMQQGGGGKLRSVLPVLSPSAWASFATGVNPGRHGIYDFVQRVTDGYNLRLVTSRDIKSPTLWRILSDAGKRVAVVNVPMTYPAEPVNGIMITGLGTPDRRTFTYPADQSSKLLAQGYRVNKTVFFRPGNEAAFLKDVYDITQRVANVSLALLQQELWDFFMVVFRDSDEMSHFFWKHMDSNHPAHDAQQDSQYANALLEYYQYLDRLTGELIEAAGPQVNVIIMSDHGVGPLYKDVFLNEWLRQQGLLTVDASVTKSRGGALASLGITRSNISQLLQSMRLGAIERGLRSTLGDKIRILPAHNRAVFPDVIDWARTQCYSYGYHGQIFINVRGREPQGLVEPGQEYADLRQHIQDLLYHLVDPDDGLPVVSQVVAQEDAFTGPYAPLGADLVVIMRDLSYITRQGYEFTGRPGQVFGIPSTFESGSHRLDGMLFVAGPDFISKKELPTYSILDLAPTILHLLSVNVDITIDGRTMWDELTQVARESRQTLIDVSIHEKQFKPPDLTEDEEKELVARLRNLGYLD
jgi:predicted AlkP superfamily phosphohydrolase/phosphomutase